MEEIKQKYIVQLVTNNWSNFKKADEMIKDKYPHIIWDSLHHLLYQPNNKEH